MESPRFVRWALVAMSWLAVFTPIHLRADSRGFWYGGFDPEAKKSGTQYWVGPSGDDAGPGTHAQPWRTLDHARQNTKGGDTVNLLPGLYFFDGRFGPAGPSEQAKIEDIYLLYDAAIEGVPKEACRLLTGRPWIGALKCPETRGEANRLPPPGPTTIKPAFFPHTDREIDQAVEAISKYFQEKNPRQISEDRSEELERLFDVLEVQYATTAQDYESFPPMPQGKDDATYGMH